MIALNAIALILMFIPFVIITMTYIIIVFIIAIICITHDGRGNKCLLLLASNELNSVNAFLFVKLGDDPILLFFLIALLFH